MKFFTVSNGSSAKSGSYPATYCIVCLPLAVGSGRWRRFGEPRLAPHAQLLLQTLGQRDGPRDAGARAAAAGPRTGPEPGVVAPLEP